MMPNTASAAAALLFAALPPPALTMRVESHDFGEAAEILSFSARDADGDGRRDLVFLTRDSAGGDARLSFQWLRQREPRRFERVAAPVPVPPGAIFHSIENVLDAPGDEAIFVFADRAEVRRFAGDEKGGVLATVPLEGAARCPVPGSLPVFASARDLDGDGRIDLLLPTSKGYVAALQGEGGAFSRTIDVPLESTASLETSPVSWLSAEATLPRLVVKDADGDAAAEMLRRDGETIVAHRIRGGRLETATWTAAPMAFLVPPAARDALSSATVLIDDVDSDGRADLVAALQRGSIGLGSDIATTFLYFPGAAKALSGKPAQVLALKGLALSPRLVDLDGDGAKDLLVPTADTDILSNVRKLLLRDLSVDYQGFLFDRTKKRFASTPSFSESVSIPVANVDRRESLPLVSFDGDFDGDGVKDALRVRPPGAIAVHRGSAARGTFRFEEKPAAEVSAVVGNSYSVEDLDGDGRSDAVFWSGSKIAVLLAEGAE